MLPAADAEAVGIGDSLFHGFVDTGEKIDDLLVAPVTKDGLLVGGVAAGAAAVVHVEHGIALGGEELPLGFELVIVLPVGASRIRQTAFFRRSRRADSAFARTSVPSGQQRPGDRESLLTSGSRSTHRSGGLARAACRPDEDFEQASADHVSEMVCLSIGLVDKAGCVNEALHVAVGD